MSTKATVAVVHQGDRIPFDGKIIDGLALVDESAHTGVSTPVLLEAAEGRNNAMFDTLIVEGWLKIESIPAAPVTMKKAEPAAPEVVPAPAVQPSARPQRSPLKLAFFLLLPLVAASLFALIVSSLTHSAVALVVAGIVGFLLGGYESRAALSQ